MLTGIIPLKLNKKADYYFAMTILPKEQYKALFQELLDNATDWINVGQLSYGQIGVTDATHKVVSVTQYNGTTISYQYSLQNNPKSQLFNLGFSIQEVRNIVSNA